MMGTYILTVESKWEEREAAREDTPRRTDMDGMGVAGRGMVVAPREPVVVVEEVR